MIIHVQFPIIHAKQNIYRVNIMAKQIQIYINSDDTSDEDIIEINVQDLFQLTSSMTQTIYDQVAAIIGLSMEQWKQDCQKRLHVENPQAPFGKEVIHDN